MDRIYRVGRLVLCVHKGEIVALSLSEAGETAWDLVRTSSRMIEFPAFVTHKPQEFSFSTSYQLLFQTKVKASAGAGNPGNLCADSNTLRKILKALPRKYIVDNVLD
jgi:hypothetical protein